MNPTIEAALIAAGVGVLGILGTVAASVVSSVNTRMATQRTVNAGVANTRATLDAAREDRLWEKRAAAYEETLSGLLHRQMKRRHDLRRYRLDQASEQQLKGFFDGYDPPGLFEAQGRLVAYASEPVMEASRAASEAHGEVRARYQRYSMMADDNKLAAESGQGAAHGGEETIAALRDVGLALDDAEAKDEELIRLIREELRSKPEATAAPVGPPPKRRSWRYPL